MASPYKEHVATRKEVTAQLRKYILDLEPYETWLVGEEVTNSHLYQIITSLRDVPCRNYTVLNVSAGSLVVRTE
jgi:hypothetical protein